MNEPAVAPGHRAARMCPALTILLRSNETCEVRDAFAAFFSLEVTGEMSAYWRAHCSASADPRHAHGRLGPGARRIAHDACRASATITALVCRLRRLRLSDAAVS
jgi:hypothetical protein